MLRTRTLLTSLLTAGLTLATTTAAHAGMIADVRIEPFGANHMWTYNVEVQGRVHVKPGDYFTIYDFQGALPGSDSAPAGWELSVANTTKLTGSQTTPNDAPAHPNYTWTYLGTDDLASGWMGEFSLVSPWQNVNLSDFSFVSTAHRNDNERPFQDITSVEVPVPQPEEEPPPGGEEPPPPGEEPPAETPEPATLLLFGVGLPALGLLKRRK